MAKSNIIILGDIHARWAPVNNLINKKKPEIILQVGDFGWFPHINGKTEQYTAMTSQGWAYKYKAFEQYGLKMQNTSMLWCHGNHENHADLIERVKSGKMEVMPSVFYMPFGTTVTLDDGRVVLFCGGARSTDQQWRTEGLDWWPEEEVTLKDLDKLPEEKVDIVISHTCPDEFLMQMDNRNIIRVDLTDPSQKDGSRHALSYVLNKYMPDLWYFGHYHKACAGQFRGTRWYCLDMVGHGKQYWRWLK